MHILTTDIAEVDGEPRILDVTLAERLGFDRPRDIRQLVERNKAELERHGGLRRRTANPSALGGRPGIEYWLNEAQALLVCMFSRTEKAAQVRKEVIDVFMAYRQGKLVRVREHFRRPAQPAITYERDLVHLAGRGVRQDGESLMQLTMTVSHRLHKALLGFIGSYL